MDESASFGAWIRRRRKVLDLTQDALATRASVSVAMIRRLEADERRPSKEVAAHLAEALEVPPADRAVFLKVARAEVVAEHLRPAEAHPVPRLPLRPHVRPRTNLLIQPTPFVGRESEMMQGSTLLQRPEVRLITLIGVGGTGKTRLAMQLAAARLNDFADGVWFVDLAPISDPALVASTIATTLGVGDTADHVRADALAASLYEQHLLLVLDNFEQVVSAGPFIADLLQRVSGLKVLVTSRVVLGVYGEYTLDVPPLQLPDRADQRMPEDLMHYAAIRLFVERAQAARPDFRLTADNAGAVTAICQQLDGLPLAIELAAARTRHLPLAALLKRLQSRLGFLIGGPRTLPSRQQTLHRAIGWSYDLLAPAEQQLFARLAIFVGGCTVEAVEDVCRSEHDPDVDVFQQLTSLVDQSLLQQREGLAGEPRFTMLETIREYALERLAASEEAERLAHRHAIFFVTLAERAGPELYAPYAESGRHTIEWLGRLDSEYDNLRTAFRWLLDRREVALSLRLGLALKPFWYLRGYYREGRQWLDAALALPDHADAREQRMLRVKVLHAAAEVAAWQGDDRQWTVRLEQSLAVARDLGDTAGCAAALYRLGETAHAHAAAAHARALLEESLALYQTIGDTYGTALVFKALGALARDQGNAAQAMSLLNTSVALIREGGTTWQIAHALWEAGDLARAQEDTRQAWELLEESLAHFRAVEAGWGIGSTLNILGLLAGREGDPVRARTLLRESLAQFQALDHTPGVWGCLIGLVGVARLQGQPERAVRVASAAERLGVAVGADRAPHLSPADRRDYEEHLTAVRAVMSATHFETAWSEGRDMTLEQAIAYALEADQKQSGHPQTG